MKKNTLGNQLINEITKKFDPLKGIKTKYKPNMILKARKQYGRCNAIITGLITCDGKLYYRIKTDEDKQYALTEDEIDKFYHKPYTQCKRKEEHKNYAFLPLRVEMSSLEFEGMRTI